ncbi:MAG: GTP-binding protein, partial [Candidatus Electrothrix sp. AUS4]|nr:GTP-binding protein [Candidatus Electrothrix sp. AUS4]
MGFDEALRLIKKAAETGATKLNLSGHNLTELPPELFQLKELRELDLDHNQLSELPQELFQLKNLTRLRCCNNRLTALPPEIALLSHLTALNCCDNQLTSLPAEFFQLGQLTILYFCNNQLTSLSPEILQLEHLEELYIYHNRLSSLPPELFQLTSLHTLWLGSNQLSVLPEEVAKLPNLLHLDLEDNPLISPPYELAVQGLGAIYEYFADLEGETRELAEVKVIVVGEGTTGKTSLVRLLCGEQFNENEPMTHGIRIKQCQSSGCNRTIRCKLWDFGGQEIMQATHQFFLSHRCLYVLVLDGRKNERSEHWLRYIETFGDGSPVLVVLNKWDQNPDFELNRPFL